MKGKKRAIGGWVFAFVFMAVQLLYCALDLGRKVSMRTPPFDDIETPMGELIDQVIAFLRHFLAGPSLVASPSETLVPREIGGACLIGLFVVAASVWLLGRYGWKRTCLYWGAALALSLLLCNIMGNVVASRFSSLVIFPWESIEVARRSAGYVLLYQIPAWLLYAGLRKIFRDAGEREKTE